MRVAIRIQPQLGWRRSVSHDLTTGLDLSLRAAAALSAVLGLWRLGADMGWTSEFFIPAGLLSHWQVWFAVAIGMKAASTGLNRRVQS